MECNTCGARVVDGICTRLHQHQAEVTPEEVLERAKAIRDGWDEETEAKRRVGKQIPLEYAFHVF